MGAEETITCDSGKVVTAHLSDDGEPEKFTWEAKNGKAELTENEYFNIQEWMEDQD